MENFKPIDIEYFLDNSPPRLAFDSTTLAKWVSNEWSQTVVIGQPIPF